MCWLAIKQELGNKQGITQSLERLATLMISQGYVERAVRLLGVVTTLHEGINAPLSTAEHAWREQSIAATHAQINQATFDTAWAEGRRMTMEQAVAYALEQG